MQRDRAPSQSLYILHRMIEQIGVPHPGRKPRYRELPLFPVDHAIKEAKPAISY
ncbi:hypothetical protein D3C83_218240 [compost metagenome]